MIDTLEIEVNGDRQSLPSPLNVAELLRRFKLEPLRVAVEVNQQLVKRTTFEQTPLRQGDKVEIVTLVGGG